MGVYWNSLFQLIIIAIAIRTLIGSKPEVCQNGWKFYGDSCYILFRKNNLSQADAKQIELNQTDAKEVCKYHNSTLVKIKNKEEINFISENLLDKGPNEWRNIPNKMVWLGGNLSSQGNYAHTKMCSMLHQDKNKKNPTPVQKALNINQNWSSGTTSCENGKSDGLVCKKIINNCEYGWDTDTDGINCYKIFSYSQYKAQDICEENNSTIHIIKGDKPLNIDVLADYKTCLNHEISNTTCKGTKNIVCEKKMSKKFYQSKKYVYTSSIFNDDKNKYGPHLVIDGNETDGLYFRSKAEEKPYIILTSRALTKISNISIINKISKQMKTEVRIGNETLPADFKGKGEKIMSNNLCGTLTETNQNNGNGVYTINCASTTLGHVITIQIIGNGNQTLTINEVIINKVFINTPGYPEIISTIVISVTVTTIIFFIIIFWYKRNQTKNSTMQMMKEALNRNELSNNPDNPVSNAYESTLWNRNYEINENQFTIEHTIGNGNFGIVSVGTVKNMFGPGDTKVAIKQIKNSQDMDQLNTFIGELKILSNLGSHLNLVNLVAACTSETTNKICILLEFCSLGDLKKYLLDNKKMFLGNIRKFDGHINTHFNPTLLLNWCYQIAKGMEYLEEKMVMHGDLAARNILIAEDFTAKISDFGLSKHMYYREVYKKTERRMIPWAWMGLEYLQTGNFHMKSDVWSFGVLLWEIFSLGHKPYGIEPYEDVKKKLESGERLPIPDDMNDLDNGKDIYFHIMTPCWNAEPEKRPNFKTLVENLKNTMQTDEVEKYNVAFKKFQEILKKAPIISSADNENNSGYLYIA